jgi:MFS family permease
VFGVIVAISFCHLLNDMMQSLLPAIYPNLKSELDLSFSQIGTRHLVYQLTASILQPLVGLYADKRPTPLALPGGTLFSLAGLLVLSIAHSYWLLLVGAALLGMGSSVFHPESSRVARMAAGRRHGLAQSMFQVGGNAGSALGPLAAAIVSALGAVQPGLLRDAGAALLRDPVECLAMVSASRPRPPVTGQCGEACACRRCRAARRSAASRSCSP